MFEVRGIVGGGGGSGGGGVDGCAGGGGANPGGLQVYPSCPVTLHGLNLLTMPFTVTLLITLLFMSSICNSLRGNRTLVFVISFLLLGILTSTF